MKSSIKLLGISVTLVAAVAARGISGPELTLYNPYERPKNGPPLTNVFYKAEPAWLLKKLREPTHHPSARMADFKFSDDEALDVMAYLKSIAEEAALPSTQWPAWAAKGFDEMDDDEMDAMFALVDRGKAVWGDARCTICHKVNGPGGKLIGGFVDLRVGGIDLQIAGTKLKRDWLYAWLKEPKAYFPDTLMPRFRFSDEEMKALVEYILRDDAFRPLTEEEEEDPDHWRALDEPERAARGKRLIELSRCVLCHDIRGIPELLDRPALEPPAPARSFAWLVYDLRCLSCHSIEGRGGTYAPDLTSEGSRLQAAWITSFVASPDMIRPLSQQMPKFNLTAEEAKIIASYMNKNRLDARIPAEIPGGPITTVDIERGREVFSTRGCVSCHTVSEEPGGVVGPDLTTVGDRLKPGYIWFHLKNPYAVSPTSAEPDFGLSDEEARALSAYLSSRIVNRESRIVNREWQIVSRITNHESRITNHEFGQELINRRDQARWAFLATPQGVYRHYCAHCHGDDGKGDGRLWATELSPSPADLTALGADKEYVIETIRNGSAAHGKSHLCPPWGRTLSPADVERLAQYIVSLDSESSGGGSPPSQSNSAAPTEPGGEPFPWLLVAVLLLEMVVLWRRLRQRKEVYNVPEDSLVRG